MAMAMMTMMVMIVMVMMMAMITMLLLQKPMIMMMMMMRRRRRRRTEMRREGKGQGVTCGYLEEACLTQVGAKGIVLAVKGKAPHGGKFPGQGVEGLLGVDPHPCRGREGLRGSRGQARPPVLSRGFTEGRNIISAGMADDDRALVLVLMELLLLRHRDRRHVIDTLGTVSHVRG